MYLDLLYFSDSTIVLKSFQSHQCGSRVSILFLFLFVTICDLLSLPSMASSSPLSEISHVKHFKSFLYQITKKLDGDNLPLWVQQVEPVLRAHKLHRFCVALLLGCHRVSWQKKTVSQAHRIMHSQNGSYKTNSSQLGSSHRFLPPFL